MTRSIIDLPPPLLRMTAVTWDIDWAGQSAGGDAGGGDQVVVNQFPRFTARLSLQFDRDGIGLWRAYRARLQGRQNVARLRMLDPVTMASVGPAVNADWGGWKSGMYIEPRPQVACVGAVAAGAAQVVVNETTAHAPIQIGAHLSYADWPFLVTGRSGTGAAVTLDVLMLRTAIPNGGQIDLIPRGLFLVTDPAEGAAGYGRRLRAAPEISFSEWITR